MCVKSLVAVKQEHGDLLWRVIWPIVRASKVIDNDT